MEVPSSSEALVTTPNTTQSQVKLSMSLTKHHVIKTYLLN